MTEFNLISEYQPSGDQPQAIDALVSSLKEDSKHQTLLGVTGSGKTFTIANVIQQLQRPTLIISHNKTLAAQLYGEFKQLFPHNAVEFFISYYDYYQPEAYLPVTDTFIEKDMSINEEIDILRLKATSSLLARKDVIVISSVSCIYGIGSPAEYQEQVVQVQKSIQLNRRAFFRKLVNIHYSRNDAVFERGTFRVRGDIIEIYLAYEDIGVRLEMFGDTIDSISRFNPLTGEVLKEMANEFIYPAKHFVTDQQSIKNIVSDIREELTQRLEELRSDGALLEAQRLEQRTNFDLEMMLEVGYCSGIENYSR
ncbi:MAG: DEAD/DEAH box helicase family protein, partial [Candidatus Neomarinimicrobiota bacterium]|nr:DEAD/DEAH box helicase family protein [Candidatus Neomarinimicrobiota bacterium]